MPQDARPLSNAPDNTVLFGFTNLRQARTSRPMVIERGRGVFVFDENGRDYIEGCASFYCAALGFDEEELVQAAVRQMRALPLYTTASYRGVPVVMKLAERLAAMVPMAGARVAFGASGSEANDFLLKFMRFRNIARGEPQRRRVIARYGSYHGSTTSTAALGGSPVVHQSFGVPMDDVINVTQPDFHNRALPGEDEAGFVDRLIAELEAAIAAAGAETVGGFILDPISFSAGFVLPPPGYLERVCAVLRRHGILLFADEIITGFGRTGRMFGAETFSLAPDCMTVAKAMSGAFQPISAVVMSGAFYDDLERGSDAVGSFTHAGTYAGHPVAAAVALRMLELIEERGVLAHVSRVAPVLQRGIAALRGHELVADTRGLGMGGAVQLRPVGRPGEQGARLAAAMAGQGLLLRVVGDAAVIAPPLIISEAEIGELFRRLGAALAGLEGSAAG